MHDFGAIYAYLYTLRTDKNRLAWEFIFKVCRHTLESMSTYLLGEVAQTAHFSSPEKRINMHYYPKKQA